ncbi:MAG: DUF6268 family outer membrane beta-barrel protein [Bradymonadia bacterium]
MKCTLVLMLLVVFGGPSSAQRMVEGPAILDYSYYPAVVSEQPGDDQPRSHRHLQEIFAAVGLPVVHKSSKTLIFPALQYSVLLPEDTGNTRELDALHNPMLQVLVVHELSASWQGMLIAGGGLASDLGGKVTADDWMYRVSALASYQFNPDFRLGAGVDYDRRTGELRPLPLVALDWHFSETLRLSGVVPARVMFAWRAAPSLTMALAGSLTGNRYHISEERVGVEDAELAYSMARVGPTVVWHIHPMLHFRAQAGATILRRYEVFIGDERRGDGSLDNGPFFGVRLRVGPSGWRSDAPEPMF